MNQGIAMSLINSIQSMLPRPENRSREQIARDLEDEFAFHLEMKARALESEEGLDREAACGLALDRFGNLDQIRKDCQRIALKERIMLQRVNLVLMIVVMLVVVAVGAQVYVTQRYNTLALQAITADLAKMKFESQKPANGAMHSGLVRVDGDFERPGDFNLPPGAPLTLDRLVTSAGGIKGKADAKIAVKGLDPDGNLVDRFIIQRWSDANSSNMLYLIQPGDRIIAQALPPTKGSADRSEDARAAAVGDFVVRLFALVDPNDPNPDQTIRDFLASEEKGLDQKYAGDPATAGMIKELIAARRKIFESDEAIERAATAEEKAKAVTDFLASTLASTDAAAGTVSVKDVLDHASTRVAEQFADNPQLQAQVRQSIAEAQRNLQAAPQGADVSLNVSPFQGVRWKNQWTPIVNYGGQWYELRSIHGADAKALVQHCRQRHGDDRARQRVSEDLLPMLLEMGHARPANDQVDMQIIELQTGSLIAVNQAPMTAENRAKIVADNAVAAGAGRPYIEWNDAG